MRDVLNNPFMNFMTKVYDLFLLNVLTFVCCIPIVTGGAAFTALHAVMLKMTKDEEGSITKSYIKEFKENLKGSIGGWMLLLAAVLVLVFDLYLWANSNDENRSLFWGVTLFMLGFVFAVASWYFSVRAKFVDTSMSGLKRALNYCLYFFPVSVLMGGATVLLFWILTRRALLLMFIPFGLISILEYPKALFIRKTFDRLLTQEKE